MKTTHLIMIFTAWIIHGTGLTQDVKWARTFDLSGLLAGCYLIGISNDKKTIVGDYENVAEIFSGARSSRSCMATRQPF